MRLYGDRPGHVSRQLISDLLVLAWILFWAYVAWRVHERVSDLAGPGREAEEAGRSLGGSLDGAADRVGDIPFAGEALNEPFEQGAAAGRGLAEAAQDYQDAVANLAVLSAIVVFGMPVIILLVAWLPRRLAWVAAASAATRLLRSDPAAALDLFALRALASQPPGELGKVVTDPVGGWRSRDPGVVAALADLELARVGLRAPAP